MISDDTLIIGDSHSIPLTKTFATELNKLSDKLSDDLSGVLNKDIEINKLYTGTQIISHKLNEEIIERNKYTTFIKIINDSLNKFEKSRLTQQVEAAGGSNRDEMVETQYIHPRISIKKLCMFIIICIYFNISSLLALKKYTTFSIKTEFTNHNNHNNYYESNSVIPYIEKNNHLNIEEDDNLKEHHISLLDLLIKPVETYISGATEVQNQLTEQLYTTMTHYARDIVTESIKQAKVHVDQPNSLYGALVTVFQMTSNFFGITVDSIRTAHEIQMEHMRHKINMELIRLQIDGNKAIKDIKTHFYIFYMTLSLITISIRKIREIISLPNTPPLLPPTTGGGLNKKEKKIKLTKKTKQNKKNNKKNNKKMRLTKKRKQGTTKRKRKLKN